MTEFELDGLQCAHCALKIEKTLQNNNQLSNVTLSFATKKLYVESELPGESLTELIQGEVDSIETGISVGTENTEEKKLGKVLLFRHSKTIIGAVVLLLVLLMQFPHRIQLTLYLAAYLLVGGDIALRALKNLFRGKLFDENFLMFLATVGAFALREYTEAVAVLLFYKIGEAFQEYAVDNSRRSIKSLLNIKAEYANLLDGNSTRKVQPGELQIDDMIIVLAGEKVPVDGILIKGNTTFNTSAITGESLPRVSALQEEVLSGFINIDAPVTVQVTKSFENSAVSRILHMVENASGKKAPTEQFITKFAGVYTPIVVFSALILAFLPPLLGAGDFREWISRALIFLVISCPCALVLSVPLGFFGGLGAASRKGILIKGGNYLEALNSINTFVFDKTGTLTKGNFAVGKISGVKTLELAAQLEKHSTHPIAQSIVAAYGQKIDESLMENIREFPGLGLAGDYKKTTLIVGNRRLMEQFSIGGINNTAQENTVYVARDGDFCGAIEITDEVKPSVLHLAQELKSNGAEEVIMLTGDLKRIAEKTAVTLGIDSVYSELLPEDKLNHVESLIDKGKKVLFTGDGINDAPVLARANIGVAMGGLGSDAAIEAADIVIMSDDPSKLLVARIIARYTRRIVLQNIIFALSVKIFFLTLGALGYANMYEAIFADVGVALLAVLNSMRILKK